MSEKKKKAKQNPTFVRTLIHIPKNGGTSIRNLLDPYKPVWEKHACLQEIYDAIGQKEYAKLKCMAVVRNPYARLYSWWKFHKQTKQLEAYQCDFSEWMLKWCPHHWTHSPHFGLKHGLKYDAYTFAPVSQKSFLTINGRLSRKVKLFKLEELNQRWDEVCEFFGKSVPPRTDNQSARHDEWETAYNKVTSEIASILCEKDIKEFGYDFR